MRIRGFLWNLLLSVKGCAMTNSLTKLSHMTDDEIVKYAKQMRNASTSTDLEIELAERLENLLAYSESDECQEILDLVNACNGDIEGTLNVLNLLREYGCSNREDLEACLNLNQGV